MLLTIKSLSELWREDDRIFTEEADCNGQLFTLKFTESQRKVQSMMMSAKIQEYHNFILQKLI